MGLHLAEIAPYQPSEQMATYATAVHAALVEAGYPDAHVSANNVTVIVSREHTNLVTGEHWEGPPAEVIERAFAVTAQLRPARAGLTGGKVNDEHS